MCFSNSKKHLTLKCDFNAVYLSPCQALIRVQSWIQISHATRTHGSFLFEEGLISTNPIPTGCIGDTTDRFYHASNNLKVVFYC